MCSAPQPTGGGQPHPALKPAQTMCELLEKVVSEGGGKNAYIEGYRVGGKTGTAQVYIDGKVSSSVHIGSFIGFAPADAPRFAVLVIVNAADVPVDYGGTTAAPFARQIIEDTLNYLGYEKPGAAQEQRVEIPDFQGGRWTRRSSACAAWA